MTLDHRIANVKQRIVDCCDQVGRNPHSVSLLAVSKTRDAQTIQHAYDAGLRQFGENYLQEALAKQEDLAELNIEWHFIGPIQSNKTRDIGANFDWVHTVDRLKLVQRLAVAATGVLNVCIQVNISEEASKSGCLPSEIDAIATAISLEPKLKLRGLMAIPAATENVEQQRQAFAKLQALFIELKTTHPHIDTLSMGMSGDLEAAIAEGATIVRVGTDIFGPRQYRN